MTVLVFLDPSTPAGRLADASVAQLLVTDQGVIRGDGVFESMLYTAGAVRKLDAHLSRLRVSAASCDLDLPDEQSWRAAIATAVDRYEHERHPGPEDPDEAVVKLVLTRGPEDQPHGTAWVTVSPAPESGRRQREEGVAVVLLDRGYDSSLAERAPWLLMGAKTLSYAVNMAALRHAAAGGFDDVIYLSSDGEVLEGPRSTVVIARQGELISPPAAIGILEGTMLGAMAEVAEAASVQVRRERLLLTDLLAADGVWLLSSVTLCARVRRIDDVGLSAGDPGVNVADLVDRAVGRA